MPTAASPPDDDAADRAMRFVTWNCHGSVGPDGRCDGDRTMAVLDRLAPDILALQEVDGRAHLGRRERAFEFFGERLGPHMVEARTVRRRDRDYGHLLWSRWPIRQSVVHRLPGPGMEERAAIEARVETPAGPVRVLAFHLGLVPWTRARQAAFIAGILRGGDAPTVAMGDTNEWRRKGPVDRALGAALPSGIAAPSWPARRPTVSMDRIYGSRHWQFGPSGTDRLSRSASDHLALVATASLPAR